MKKCIKILQIDEICAGVMSAKGVMMSNIDAVELLRAEISHIIKYIDVAPLMEKVLEQSLCRKLLNFEVFDSPDKFKITLGLSGNAYVSRRKSETTRLSFFESIGKGDTVLVPSNTIAVYPTFQMSEWLDENFDLNYFVYKGLTSMVGQMDSMLIKLLVNKCDDSKIANYVGKLESSHDIAIKIMSQGQYLKMFGEDLSNEFEEISWAYTIPKLGEIPKHRVDEMSRDLRVNLIEREQDGIKILVSNKMSDNTIICCGDKVGNLCHLPNVYAIPHIEPQKLRAGFVIAWEVGICVHSNRYLHHEEVGFS